MREIVHLRLINGDELIGYLVSQDDKEIVLNSPLVVDERVDPKSGASMVVLSKYILFNQDDEVMFKTEHILTKSRVVRAIEKFYTNSLIYNEKYVNKAVITEIEKVNALMESDVQDGISSLEDDLSFVSNTPVSNTVH